MSGATLHAPNGTYEVVKILPRMLGAADLIVAYRVRGRKTTYAAYRHEPDGAWKALNGGWLLLDKAIEESAGTQEYRPLVSPKLIRFLSEAIGLGVEDEVSVRGGPELPDFIEDEYWRGQDT